MKKMALFLTVVFLTMSVIGCGKKKKEEAVVDGLNGVVSEKVVSVTDQARNNNIAEGVPVYVENAEKTENATGITEQQPAGEMAAVTNNAVPDRPTSKQIQQALKNAYVYSGKIDGDIGPKTKIAIEEFQSKNGLKADGKVGAKTWKALSVYLNKPTEVENPTNDIQTVGQ